MKVLIVNFSDLYGGASRATYRLHKALLNAGCDSKMLVQDKISNDYTVIPTSTKKIPRGVDLLRPTIDQLPLRRYKERTKTPFSVAWFGFNDIATKINSFQADVVHLHWICRGMVKIGDLLKIKAPIVWSFHDMWAFTGGCHYDEDCNGYLQQCGSCKVLRSQKKNDLSCRIFREKAKVYPQIMDLTVIGLSKWIMECSEQSHLLKGVRHVNIPNPINAEQFKPFDKIKSRELWALPQNKKLILFGAMDSTTTPRKGFDELTKALDNIQDSDVEIVIFGSPKPENPPQFKFETHYLGHLSDDISLMTLYSAVDVTIVPSLQENLSNVILESLACATPVVGFDIGGNSDLVDHKQNGYLARPFDIADLTDGVEWVLNSKEYDKLSHNSREKVLAEFDSKIVVPRYIDLYKSLLK